MGIRTARQGKAPQGCIPSRFGLSGQLEDVGKNLGADGMGNSGVAWRQKTDQLTASGLQISSKGDSVLTHCSNVRAQELTSRQPFLRQIANAIGMTNLPLRNFDASLVSIYVLPNATVVDWWRSNAWLRCGALLNRQSHQKGAGIFGRGP